MKSEEFAIELGKAWHKESNKSNFSEVQQFRALMRSFASLRNNFDIEEFHGMKHQVYFNGEGTWKRTPARCEISDLLVVSYAKSKTSTRIRVTFIQAKKSNEKHNLCEYPQKMIAPTNFKANLEQWDLLSRRPEVLAIKPFNCRPNILKDAILPSIGSIMVFHKNSSNLKNFFYVSADKLTPLSSPKNRFAKLKTLDGNSLREINGHKERVFACCIHTFAKSLYDLEIGTPVHHESGLSDLSTLFQTNNLNYYPTISFCNIISSYSTGDM